MNPNVTQLQDLDKKTARLVRQLINERAVLAYSFSWEKLKDLLARTGLPEDEIGDCIVARKEKELKPLVDAINTELAEIFQDKEVKILEVPDPWGRMKQFVYMESTSSSLNRQTFTMIMMREYGVSAEAIQTSFERATTKKPYITVQCRDAEDAWTGEKK